MATDTLHYHLKKPASADRVAIGDINDNSDTIDGYLYQANERANQMADDYNASETYNTGDYVRRENYIYKCNTDNTTGTWDATKWDRVKVMEEITQGGGGGSSTLAGLDDVSLATPTDGQLLGYNGISHKWENVNGGGGGSSTLAGLSDVSVSGVANKDIIRYNSTTQKYEKSSDLTDLELSVSQLSSSVLSIAGDVDTLELTVSQMSASTLPYDANTSTKQKIDNVESSIPTSASDLPYSSGVSTKDKIDEVDGKILEAFSLVLPQVISSSTSTVYTYNSRKFSDYDMISFHIGNFDYNTKVFTVRSSCTLAKSPWVHGSRRLIMNALHGSITSSVSDYNIGGINIEYRDDTSVNVELTGSLVINALEIVGYKV